MKLNQSHTFDSEQSQLCLLPLLYLPSRSFRADVSRRQSWRHCVVVGGDAQLLSRRGVKMQNIRKHPISKEAQAYLVRSQSGWGVAKIVFNAATASRWEMKLSALRSWRQWEWVGSKSRGSFHFRGNLWEYSENFTLRRLPVDQIQNSKSSVCIFLRWSSQTNFWVIESVNVMKNANGLHQLCKASGMVVQERIEEKFKMF